MGYLINNKVFVSTLTAIEIAECKHHAFWLAERNFKSTSIESFDLGNVINGYMTAEITTCYQPGQRRIWFYLDKQMIYTQRVDAGQGARRAAEDYYTKLVKVERQRESERRQMQPEGVR